MGLIYILICFVGTETAVGRRFESGLKQTILITITLKEIVYSQEIVNSQEIVKRNSQLKIKHRVYFKNGILFKIF